MREGLAILVIAIVVLAVGAYMMGSSMARQGEERTVAYTATYTAYAPGPERTATQTVTIAVGPGQVYTVTQAQPQVYTYTYTYTQRYVETSTVTVTAAQNQDLEARYRQLLDEYNWLREEYNKAMLTIANLTSANAELSKRVAELEARLKQLEEEIASVRSQLPFNGSVVVLSRVVDLSSCKGTKVGVIRTIAGWQLYKFYLTDPAFTYHTPDFSLYVYCYIEWVNSTHFYFAALMILGKPTGIPPGMPDDPPGLGLLDVVIAPALGAAGDRVLYYNPPPDWQLLGHSNRTVAAAMYFVAFSRLEIVGFYRTVTVWKDGKILGMDPYDVMSVPPHRVGCATGDYDYVNRLMFGMVLATSCAPLNSQNLSPPDYPVPTKVVPKGYSLLIAQAMVGGIADPQWANATRIGLYIRVAA